MTAVSSESLAACIAVAEAHATPYIKLNSNRQSAERYVARIPASAITRETRGLDGHLVAFMSPRWPYYHSLHPALWRVAYLRARLAHARAVGAGSAWAFEEMPSEGVPHLAANMVWPSEPSGYLLRGAVRFGVALRMKHPALAPLRRLLLRDALIGLPSRLAAVAAARCRRIPGCT